MKLRPLDPSLDQLPVKRQKTSVLIAQMYNNRYAIVSREANDEKFIQQLKDLPVFLEWLKNRTDRTFSSHQLSQIQSPIDAICPVPFPLFQEQKMPTTHRVILEKEPEDDYEDDYEDDDDDDRSDQSKLLSEVEAEDELENEDADHDEDPDEDPDEHLDSATTASGADTESVSGSESESASGSESQLELETGQEDV